MVYYADSVRSTLSRFDELDAAQKILASSTPPKVHEEAFAQLLSRLDGALDFLQLHPTFLDAASFTLRFRQLQSRALAELKAQVDAQWRLAADASVPPPGTSQAAVGAGANAEPNAKKDLAEILLSGEDTAAFYLRFFVPSPIPSFPRLTGLGPCSNGGSHLCPRGAPSHLPT